MNTVTDKAHDGTKMFVMEGDRVVVVPSGHFERPALQEHEQPSLIAARSFVSMLRVIARLLSADVRRLV